MKKSEKRGFGSKGLLLLLFVFSKMTVAKIIVPIMMAKYGEMLPTLIHIYFIFNIAFFPA